MLYSLRIPCALTVTSDVELKIADLSALDFIRDRAIQPKFVMKSHLKKLREAILTRGKISEQQFAIMLKDYGVSDDKTHDIITHPKKYKLEKIDDFF